MQIKYSAFCHIHKISLTHSYKITKGKNFIFARIFIRFVNQVPFDVTCNFFIHILTAWRKKKNKTLSRIYFQFLYVRTELRIKFAKPFVTNWHSPNSDHAWLWLAPTSLRRNEICDIWKLERTWCKYQIRRADGRTDYTSTLKHKRTCIFNLICEAFIRVLETETQIWLICASLWP